jgi:hypothetical protein
MCWHFIIMIINDASCSGETNQPETGIRAAGVGFLHAFGLLIS